MNSRLYLLVTQGLIAFISLLSGKFIALHFEPSTFGTFNLHFALYTFFLTLIISPFNQFMKMFWKRYNSNLMHKGLMKIVISLIAIFFFTLAITLNFAYYIDPWLLLMFVILIPANFFYNLLLDYLNINNELKLYATANLLKNFAGLLILFLVYVYGSDHLNTPILLWLFQTFGFVVVIFLFLKHFKVEKRKLTDTRDLTEKLLLIEYLKYTWPLVILAFWSWINNYFDRFVIEYYLDIDAVGIYNANYTVGSKFFILINPFFLTLLTPKVYNNDLIHKRKILIKKYAKYYTFLAIPILSAILIFRDSIGILLLSENYKTGFNLIFWTSLAYFILTIIYLYETIFYAEGKTNVILVSNFFSAICSILLNAILVPIYGLYGAVISTIFAFTIRFIYVLFYFKKL